MTESSSPDNLHADSLYVVSLGEQYDDAMVESISARYGPENSLDLNQSYPAAGTWKGNGP